MNDVLAVMPATDSLSKVAAQWGLTALDGKVAYNKLPAPPMTGTGLGEPHIQAALNSIEKTPATDATRATVVCYFGHGMADSWVLYSEINGKLNFDRRILDKANAAIFKDVIVASIACLAGKTLGPAIAAKGGIFIGFTSIIAWKPGIEQTETALHNCLADLVESIIRLRGAITRADLEAVFDAHLSYWKDQSDRGSDGAAVAFGYLGAVRDCMILIK